VEKITTFIVDDEARSRSALTNLLGKYCKSLKIVGEADNITEAVNKIERLRPNLLFLDIRLKEGTSFEILRQLTYNDYMVVFTTAYDDYAIKAFKFSAIDYLLKPIDVEELISAVNKVERFSHNNSRISNALINQLLTFNLNDPNIAVPMEQSVEFVRIKKILSLKSEGPYTEIYLKDGSKIVSSKHLGHYQQVLNDFGFFRTHHSHLVNLGSVKRYIKQDGGYLELIDGSTVPISRRRKEQFTLLFKGK
tara:strand:+ start:21793 stop:22542 length:750 start_codon:yes stop_codon:yes gene_type:complete